MKKWLISVFAVSLAGAACSPASEPEADGITDEVSGGQQTDSGSMVGSVDAAASSHDGAASDAANVSNPTRDAQSGGGGADARTDASSTQTEEAGTTTDAAMSADATRDGSAPDAFVPGNDAGSDAGGGGGPSCALPTTFKWTGTNPLAQPKNGAVSMKDFAHAFHNGQHVLYFTTFQSSWGSGMMTFKDWPDAAAAPQIKTSFGVAPTLFYFTPKNVWVLAYQWGPHKFSYRTSSDPTNANGWSAEKSLYNTALPPNGTGPIDQTVICDSAKCYLYYAGDNGHIYKSSLPIASFPGEFPAAQDSGIVGTAQNLFEAVQVYKVKGSDKYLMIVEAQGSGRYFRAWTATSLEGPWTLLTNEFAIKKNVTFPSNWTNDISHGDIVRTGPDETFTIDPCNLQMVFQGRDPSINTEYGKLPYRLGLITLQR